MRHCLKQLLLWSSFWGAVIGTAGCATNKFASQRKPSGVAVVDLDSVAKRLGRENEIAESSADFQERIRPVAEKIAKERGLKTVVTKDNPHVLVSASDADITDAVVARCKKIEAEKAQAASPDSKEEQEAEAEREQNSWRNNL